MRSRFKPKRWLATMTVAAVLCGAGAAARADSPTDADALLPDAREMARVEAAIDRGLEHLVKAQLPNGAFGNSRAGVQALCLLAFLGRGHEPGRGPYKLVTDRSIAYVLSLQDKSGYFSTSMYDHGLCTLAMIEAYGFVPSLEMRRACQNAVDLIVKSQSPAGGWRYNPSPGDHDMSVTVMQVVALRAAMNARLDVPQKTIEGAIRWTKSCAIPSGGFGYQPGGLTVPQSTTGPLSMILLGQFDDPSVKKSLDYLNANRAAFTPNMGYFFYSSYYAMQAHFQAGGEFWARWHPKARDQILSMQTEDGGWPGGSEEPYNAQPFKTYSAAMACICLEVYMHYLPAYQR